LHSITERTVIVGTEMAGFLSKSLLEIYSLALIIFTIIKKTMHYVSILCLT